jgi:hypothetical protein
MGMTSPRYSYGGASYAATPYPDTPIYDLLVAERGTPQIAPIRVPAAYEPTVSSMPALPPALPALPSGPSEGHTPPQGYPAVGGQQPMYPGMTQPGAAAQPAPLQQAMPYAPQQQRGYPDPRQYQQQQQQQQQQPQAQPYQQPQMRPVAPRPAPRQAPGYDDPYGGQQYQGRGY